MLNTATPHTRPTDSASIDAKPWRGPRPPERVLAIRLHAHGDTILTLPYLSALRRRRPNATLDFLTRREVSAIPRSISLFDRVFAFGGGRDPRRQLLSVLPLIPRLWLRRYDVIVDLQCSRVSRIVRILLHPPSWSEFDRFSPRLAGERTRTTIEAAGLGPLDVYPDIVLRHGDTGPETLRDAGWDGASELIVLNPAGTFAGRRWPLDSYVRFAELWLARVSPATQFAVLGLPSRIPEAHYLKERLGARLVNLVGRTSPAEAFALLRRARLVLSEDSGLMHMAWVAGSPTLALFGASRSSWARPHGNYSECLRACRRADGECIEAARCLAAPPECLDRLSPEVVVERARALLDRMAQTPKMIHVGGRTYGPPADS